MKLRYLLRTVYTTMKKQAGGGGHYRQTFLISFWGRCIPITDTESCCQKNWFHYRDRSVGMSGENLSLQMQLLSCIPITFHCRYSFRAQTNAFCNHVGYNGMPHWLLFIQHVQRLIGKSRLGEDDSIRRFSSSYICTHFFNLTDPLSDVSIRCCNSVIIQDKSPDCKFREIWVAVVSVWKPSLGVTSSQSHQSQSA